MIPNKIAPRTLIALLLLLPGFAWSDELADLRARNAQLEATVEELTLQLADALQERRSLEASLAEATASLAAAEAALASSPAPAAMSVSSDAGTSAAAPAAREVDVVEEEIVTAAGTAVAASADTMTMASALDSSGCSVSDALAGYEGNRAGNEALTAWLKSGDHINACSTEQLKEIRGAIKWDWLGYQKEAIRMLDKELAARR